MPNPATVRAVDPVSAHHANERATFFRYQPARGDDVPSYPCIEIAGCEVYAYVHPDGALRVSIHTDEAEEPLWRPGSVDDVPVTVVTSGTDTPLWSIDRHGDHTYPALVDDARQLHTAAAAVGEQPWPGMAPALARSLGDLIRRAEELAERLGAAS